MNKGANSLKRRFWLLIATTLCIALAGTAATVWMTTTPILRKMQDETILNKAGQTADALASVLADHEQFLSFLSRDPEVVSLAVGNNLDSSRVKDIFASFEGPLGLQEIALFDILNDPIVYHSFEGSSHSDVNEKNQLAHAKRALSETTSSMPMDYKLINEHGHFWLAAPVRFGDFTEGVLIGEVILDLDVLLPNHSLASKPLIVTIRDLNSGQYDQLIGMDTVVAAVGTGGLHLILNPNRTTTEQLGGEILWNVTLAISLVLLVPFAIFAIVGRATLVAPHEALELSQDALRQNQKSLSELAAIAQKANDAVVITDLAGRIKWVNPSFERLSGYSAREVKGLVPGRLLQGPQTDPDHSSSIRKAMNTLSPIQVEIQNYSKSGIPYWISLSISPLFDSRHEAYGFMAISRDVTERREQHLALLAANAEIEYQALHDSLTGLPNRRYLDREIADRIENNSEIQTIVRIDLDHFKHVNDTLGHAAGDFVLCQVGEILRQETKSEDIAARVGGDEFVILMGRGRTLAEGQTLAERLLKRIRKEMEFEGKECRIGASFGIASTADEFVAASDLLVCADGALYIAKEKGRNQVINYTPAVHSNMVETRLMAAEIETAIEQEEFVPYFQPQFDAQTLALTGLEALVRWPNKKRGMLPPITFLPIAEQLSVIPDIDAIVMRKGLAEMERLSSIGIQIPKLSFNVTAARLADPKMLEFIHENTPSGTIVSLEVLESVLVEEQGKEFEFHIDRLRDSGVSIEIDDFGSGHASIIGLMRLAPDIMKIDQRLIFPLAESDVARQMVKAIVEIGKSLNIKVTAEGVESAQHARILAELGCDYLQGYHFARPMPAEALEPFILNLGQIEDPMQRALLQN
jgi:diguanylate cyclase (GGDEF)-like protein/PAS domain S-box-containing protein